MMQSDLQSMTTAPDAPPSVRAKCGAVSISSSPRYDQNPLIRAKMIWTVPFHLERLTVSIPSERARRT